MREMLITILSTVIAGVIAVIIFVIALLRGQFDDCEEVKYQVFREDRDQ